MHEIFWYQASGIRRGIDIFKNTFPRKRFLSIMKYLRFDEKNRRRERLQTDKFSLASQVWEPFISNCQKAFNPGQNLTIDEQLLPCKARCKFIQYVEIKPDKYGLKFWLLVDVEHRYLYSKCKSTSNNLSFSRRGIEANEPTIWW